MSEPTPIGQAAADYEPGAPDHDPRATKGPRHRTILGEYEDHDVTTATVSIRNTGHGLEEVMDVDPVKLPLGATVHVVLECEVEKHRYDPVKDHPDDLMLVNMLKAGRATIVDRELVEKHLDDQQDRIELARAKAEEAERSAAGEDPLPLDDDGGGRSEFEKVLEAAEDAEDATAGEGDGDE